MMNARALVLVLVPPRIGTQHFDIGSAPLLFFTSGRLDQDLQTFFAGWVAVEMDVKAPHRALQLSHAAFGGADLRVHGGADELRNNGGGDDPNHDHHDHDLRERKARGAMRCARVYSLSGSGWFI